MMNERFGTCVLFALKIDLFLMQLLLSCMLKPIQKFLVIATAFERINVTMIFFCVVRKEIEEIQIW